MNLRRGLGVVLAWGGLCYPAGYADEAALPGWTHEAETLKTLWDPARVHAAMGPLIEHWQLAFTAIGVCAVFVAAILRVANARSGEESIGWVAATLATGALLVCAPGLASRLYAAADDLADWSGYTPYSSVDTCWHSYLMMCPTGSPAVDAQETGDKVGKALKHRTADEEEPPTDWVMSSWIHIRTIVAGSFIADNALADKFLVLLSMLIPALCWLGALLASLLAVFVRTVLFHGMGVFLPAIVGLLTFGPTRAMATQFLLKYSSIAFWPVAWALGNSLTVPLQEAIARWALSWASAVSDPHLSAPEFGLGSLSFVAENAPRMGWGLLLTVSLSLSLVGVLQICSALLMPVLLSALLSRGAHWFAVVSSSAVGAAVSTGGGEGGGGVSLEGRRRLATAFSRLGSYFSESAESPRWGSVAGWSSRACLNVASSLDRAPELSGSTEAMRSVSSSDVTRPASMAATLGRNYRAGKA